MSRSRGLFPLLLATTFGIANGVWVFAPAFKEQQEEKLEQERRALEIARLSASGEVETLRDAEAAASRTAATEAALKPDTSSNTRWPSLSFWSKEANIGTKRIQNTAPTNDDETNEESK